VHPDRPLVVTNLALGLPVLPLLALAAGAGTPVLTLLTALAFGALTLVNVLWFTTMQRQIPHELLSRLSSYDWLVSYATLPLGYAIAGLLATEIGPVPTLLLAAATLMLPPAVALADAGVRSVRTNEADTSELARRPASHPS
jgi:hypothetical protein